MILVGNIISDFEYERTINDVPMYRNYIAIQRLSGTEDIIPILISEEVVNENKFNINTYVEVKGMLQSFNNNLDTTRIFKNKLLLRVCVEEIKEIDRNQEVEVNNRVYLNGYLGKEPTCRETPKGRIITDLFIGVNYANKDSDYVPAICWRDDAIYTSEHLAAGSHIRVLGRLQSRTYEKRLEDGTMEERISYELSIYKILK